MDGRSARTILVVDDSAGVCAAVSMLLEEAGFEVDTAEHFAEGRHAATNQNYDLLIIDAQLGLDSGFQLAEQILSVRPESKIIIMTGVDTEADETYSRVQGLRLPLLQKPFSRHELLECVRQVSNRAA
jgi:DNA-binding response OmpR family regulator